MVETRLSGGGDHRPDAVRPITLHGFNGSTCTRVACGAHDADGFPVLSIQGKS